MFGELHDGHRRELLGHAPDAELVVHRHVVHPWEGLFSFYSLYGFIGIVVLVLVSKELRKIVRREEDYYDD